MYQQVLSFWFESLTPEQWWIKDESLDAEITSKFQSLHQQAIAGELSEWRATAEGALAEIIVLDQFSRNIYRDKPAAFGCDSLALVLAQNAIEKKQDMALEPMLRGFMYLPFMHSESSLIHEKALTLYQSLGNQMNLEFEIKHKVIIDKFGRYPHRNTILGRQSTAEEVAFLQQPDSSF